MNGLARFALNFVTYLVLGGGVLSFVALQSQGKAHAQGFATVVMAALGAALWSGGLTTVNEVLVRRLERAAPRAGVAFGLGALSLGGFALVLSMVAWGTPSWSFVGIGVAAGGAMQAARAFAQGQRPEDLAEDETEADGDADGDPEGPAGGR